MSPLDNEHSQIIPGQFTVDPNDWNKAIQFFEKNKNRVKCDKKINGLQRSFIKVNEKIYAIQTGDYANGKRVKGEGGYGKVKVVQDIEGNNFAVKIEGRGIRGEKNAELAIMKELGDEFYGEAERWTPKNFKGRRTHKRLYTVMKLKEGDELHEKLFKTVNNNSFSHRNIPEIEKLQLAIKVTEAIQHLHQKNILHCDIKPSNFMVNTDKDMILVSAIDFGLSLKLKKNTEEIHLPYAAGTFFYTAPEIVYQNAQGVFYRTKNPTYSKKSDIYSLGRMLKCDFNLDMGQDFFERILNSDPKKRPNMRELLDELYEKLKQQPNLSDEIKKQCDDYSSGNDFEKNINLAKSLDELCNIISDCPNKNLEREAIIKNIKAISNDSGAYFTIHQFPEKFKWENYALTDETIKNKFIELYLKEKDTLTNILSKGKNDFNNLYKKQRQSNSSSPVAKWMLNNYKKASGFISKKNKTRENQINLLVECIENIKKSAENKETDAYTKREQALNLYSVLTKIENDIDKEYNLQKSGMKKMILSQKEKLNHQYPEISTMKTSELEVRAQHIIRSHTNTNTNTNKKYKA